jgi:hypothetical protein
LRGLRGGLFAALLSPPYVRPTSALRPVYVRSASGLRESTLRLAAGIGVINA